MDETFESTNINALWLQNIYENIKNLEQIERMAREGCTSVMEYLQIPYELRPILLGETQYKNLKLMITELNLLLTDLTPILDAEDIKTYKESLRNTEEIYKKNPHLFLIKVKASDKRVIETYTTDLFNETLQFLSLMKVSIIKDISHLLYVKKEDSNKPSW